MAWCVERVRCVGLWGVLVAGVLPATALTQDRVRLSEVLPVLEGTELGILELGTAPPPGGQRMVRRSEIVGALRRAGRSAEGLVIPASTRIRREARTLEAAELRELAEEAVEQALFPCVPTEIHFPQTVRTAAGALSLRAEARRPTRSGSASVQLILEASGRTTRVSLRADVECPPPAVQPGNRVRIEVRYNNVRASAPGEARQSGRVGDTVRVTNLLTRRTVQAEIINSDTVRIAQ